jgi:hypothetical protein
VKILTFPHFQIDKFMKISAQILFFVLVSQQTAFSQNFKSKEQVDNFSYNLYLKKDWHNLIKTARAAEKQDFNFYYLQYRKAIAFYELKKYEKAALIFEKLHTENPKDEVIGEYLYYSYLFSARYEDARIFAAEFSDSLKLKLNISENQLVKALNIVAKFDDNGDYFVKHKIGEYIDQSFIEKENYFGFGLEHYIGKRFTINQGYSRVNITKLKQTEPPHTVLPPEFEEQTAQNEYYILLNSHAGKGFDISVSFHYLNTRMKAQDPNWLTSVLQNRYIYQTSSNSFAAFLGLYQRFSIFKTGISISAANLSQEKQLQPEFSLIVYPFGNYKFFTNTVLRQIYHVNSEKTETDKSVKQAMGITFFKIILIEPSITFGKISNFVDYQGMAVFNGSDPVLFRAELLLNILLAKGKYQIFVNYQHNERQNNYMSNAVQMTNNYINQSLTGGLKWNF